MKLDIDGIVPDCSVSIANTLEILQSCIKPSIYDFVGNIVCQIYKISLPVCPVCCVINISLGTYGFFIKQTVVKINMFDQHHLF